MNSIIELIPCGKTLKTFGVKGELKIDVDELFEEYLLSEKYFFLNIDGNDIPYFIESFKIMDNILIKIKDINDPESTFMISNKIMYLDKRRMSLELLTTWSDKKLPYDFKNYNLLDLTSDITSPIVKVEEFPGQLVAHIIHDSQLRTIPLNEDLIHSINHDTKLITMELAEGIFDL